MMKDSVEERGFRQWVMWHLRASWLLMWGFFMTSLGSDMLAQDRFSSVHGLWRGMVRLALIVGYIWLLWALLRKARNAESEGGIVLWAVCLGVMAWQREHAWAVVGTGLAAAACLAWLTKFYRRSLIAAIIGWSLAGPAVFLLPWTNEQRFDLVLVLGGFATAVQGGFWLARDRMDLRRRSKDIVAI